MKVIVTKDYEEASQKAAEIMLDVIKNKPNANLGLATGSTPIRLYELMREDHKANGTSYKDIKSFNLDEYYGLAQDHPQSYYYFMCHQLFNELDIDKNNINVPKGKGSIEEVCDEYNALLAKNPRDIQLLGIGSNGHVGFNELLLGLHIFLHHWCQFSHDFLLFCKRIHDKADTQKLAYPHLS